MPSSRYPNVLVVLTTAPGPSEARRIARALVEERLAACANVLPGVTSIYWWEGELQEDGETLIVLKTTREGLEELEDRLAELHPYDVPELLALDVVAGLEPYLEWVEGEVRR